MPDRRPHWPRQSYLAGLWYQTMHCVRRGRAGFGGRCVEHWALGRLKIGWAALIVAVLVAPAQAGNTAAFLVPQKAIHAPAGFKGLCARYDWVCSASRSPNSVGSDAFALAQKVNVAVNRQVRQIEDLAQYGIAEHWALPTRRGGDCEDLVLLKKKMLTERGVPSQSLLISTVLDRNLNSHAVLVLRTIQGDFVLDNLTNRILPWHKTGYTFLKLQNPRSLAKWDAVLAGGLIQDRPTASR